MVSSARASVRLQTRATRSAGRGAGAGVAGYADSDDDEEDGDATGARAGGRCRVHGLGLGCAISCCCLEPNRRSRSFQDLRESVSPRTSPRTPRGRRRRARPAADKRWSFGGLTARDDAIVGGGCGGGRAFETAADAGDAIAATDALRAITQAARTPCAARDARARSPRDSRENRGGG